MISIKISENGKYLKNKNPVKLFLVYFTRVFWHTVIVMHAIYLTTFQLMSPVFFVFFVNIVIMIYSTKIERKSTSKKEKKLI